MSTTRTKKKLIIIVEQLNKIKSWNFNFISISHVIFDDDELSWVELKKNRFPSPESRF